MFIIATFKLFGVPSDNSNHFKSAKCLPSFLVQQSGWYEPV